MRVVYVSYYFPPMGGAGVQRTLKFVRYLPDHGIGPVVLTGPTGAAGRWTPPDETLASQLPPGLAVERVDGPEPMPAGGWQGRADRWLRRPSPWTRWWREQVVATGKRIEDAEIVLCTMSPFETAEAAARLAGELGVPWVADLRDPWALDEMMTWPSRLHRRLERRSMRRALASAAAVVMNTPTAADLLRRRFPELRDKDVVAIPNGYDDADFARPAPVRDDDVFRIVHTGYLHTQSGLEQRRRSRLRLLLGGSAPGVSFLTRSHVVLLDALDRVAAADPATAARVEIVLAGVLSDADLAAVGDRPNVRCVGYVSHDESVDLIRGADLLFLPMHDLPPGARATIVPGKTYEYLASGRPVLAAVPDGDARDLVSRAEETYLCRPADAEQMAAVIRRLAQRGRVPSVVRLELARYRRSELTRELADVLRRVVQ